MWMVACVEEDLLLWSRRRKGGPLFIGRVWKDSDGKQAWRKPSSRASPRNLASIRDPSRNTGWSFHVVWGERKNSSSLNSVQGIFKWLDRIFNKWMYRVCPGMTLDKHAEPMFRAVLLYWTSSCSFPVTLTYWCLFVRICDWMLLCFGNEQAVRVNRILSVCRETKHFWGKLVTGFAKVCEDHSIKYFKATVSAL